MNRRELLGVGWRGLVASGLAGSLSGCLSSGVLREHPEVREETGQTVERSIYTPLSDESADPAFATLLVGNRGGFHLRERNPHQVWMRNETGERRKLTIDLADDSDADPWFRRTYDADPGTRLVVELRRVRSYALTIRTDYGRETSIRQETVEVPASRFDCNASATDVVVRESEIESMAATTDEGCGGLW